MPRIAPKTPPPPWQQAARLALIWGLSYEVAFLLGATGLLSLPRDLLWGVLGMSVGFGLVGAAELVWRARLVATRAAGWMRVLAGNEAAGTLVLLGSAVWLWRMPVSHLLPLFTPAMRAQLNTVSQQMSGLPVREAELTQALDVAKWLTLGLGLPILLASQAWIIHRYLRLARQAGPVPRLPPILARG